MTNRSVFIHSLLIFGLLFLTSCSQIDDLNNRTKSVDDAQKVIISKLTALDKKIDAIEKNMSDLKKPAANQANNNKPKADPNKVYDIADAGSIILGNPDAKVTVIEWTDFQ